MPYTRTLIDSSLHVHPDIDHYICLVDDALATDGYYPRNCKIVTADALQIPDFDGFAFRYDIMELNTAAKPYMFLHLFSQGYEDVIYFDPDIKVYRPIDPVFHALSGGASVVLTPHLTRPAEADSPPDDITIMKAGIYNLGFCAMRWSDEVDEMVRWWARRLRYQCINAQSEGIFVDQKFMDLVPGFLADVAILRDTTLNVAYWNLFQRELGATDAGWTIDGHPLTFFHFSGFDPRNSSQLSKHTVMFSGGNSAELEALLADYRDDLFARALNETPRANYAYERFASGTKIPTFVRHMFREQFLTWDGNPFENFEAYLNEKAPGTAIAPEGAVCTNMMFYFWERSPYLKGAFNVHEPGGTAGLVRWFIQHSHASGIDPRLVAGIADRIADARQRRPQRLPSVDPERPVAVTVVGYLTTNTGVGEAGRLTLRSLAAGGHFIEGVDVSLNVAATRDDESCRSMLTDRSNGRIQIFNINADQLPAVRSHVKDHIRADAYRIAVPFWELADFPLEWAGAFDEIDEIWAPTRFIQASLLNRVSKPVLHMPIGLEFHRPEGIDRAHFGLPEGRFIFLFSFDFLSFSGRKNPMAVLKAFTLAFRGSRYENDVSLVIKCTNIAFAGDGVMQALRDEIDGRLDIHFVDRGLSRNEMLGLVDVVDCVVSLHRSEGLGLLVAEAMALGVPVIATDYSATTELLGPDTGYPVDYKLIALKAGDYPYAQGQVWADPDLSHAAWQMRVAVEQPARNATLVAQAQRHLERQYGIASVNRRQNARFRELGL